MSLNGEAKHARWVRPKAVSGHKSVFGKRTHGLVEELMAYVLKHPYGALKPPANIRWQHFDDTSTKGIPEVRLRTWLILADPR